ncbi:MAG: hypothetical protein ABIH20_04945 [Candidatus Diapherotrites archaeon]
MPKKRVRGKRYNAPRLSFLKDVLYDHYLERRRPNYTKIASETGATVEEVLEAATFLIHRNLVPQKFFPGVFYFERMADQLISSRRPASARTVALTKPVASTKPVALTKKATSPKRTAPTEPFVPGVRARRFDEKRPEPLSWRPYKSKSMKTRSIMRNRLKRNRPVSLDNVENYTGYRFGLVCEAAEKLVKSGEARPTWFSPKIGSAEYELKKRFKDLGTASTTEIVKAARRHGVSAEHVKKTLRKAGVKFIEKRKR